MNPSPVSPIEQPTLGLGMVGFSPEQRTALASLIAHPRPGLPSWRLVSFWDADAWWVNGSRVSVLPDGNLRVTAGRPQERTLTLRLEEVHRPVAFSTPLGSSDFEAVCTFDPGSESAIHRVLIQFDRWLQPMLFKAALGALIIERGTTLRGSIYHVTRQATLLAVLDFRHGHAAVLPTASPLDLIGAHWDRRPTGAHDLPESFALCTPAQLVWSYARHTTRDLLPARYRTEMIYYRHEPRVPMGWLRDSTLRVLSTLFTAPGDFRGLHERTEIPERALAEDLACLYYAGAVTTTPFKAAGSVQVRPQEPVPAASDDEVDSTMGRSTLPPIDAERTAPARLYQNPRSETFS
jgi:hypothetical protein